MPIIDSHHHLWDPAIRRHAWLDGLPQIAGRYGIDDLRPLAEEAGVVGTVLVQVLGSVDETREFLATAAAEPLIRGVVGWVDLTDPGVADTLAELKEAPGGDLLVGIRHLAQDEPDRSWLARDDVRRGVAAVGAAGLAYDLLVKPSQLDAAYDLAASLPEVRFVLDHLGKPDIEHDDLDAWRPGFERLASLPHVAAKVSGILTEAGDDRSVAALVPAVRTAVESFGPHRLMIGSDWPVSLLAEPYPVVMERLTATLRAVGVEGTALQAVHGDTASAWYRL